MATIKKYDAAGNTSARDLIGESGYFALSSDPRYTYEVADDGIKFTERTYYDGNYVYYTEYDYTAVTKPSPDIKFTAARKFDPSGDLLESWTSLNILNSDVIRTGAIGLFEGEVVEHGD